MINMNLLTNYFTTAGPRIFRGSHGTVFITLEHSKRSVAPTGHSSLPVTNLPIGVYPNTMQRSPERGQSHSEGHRPSNSRYRITRSSHACPTPGRSIHPYLISPISPKFPPHLSTFRKVPQKTHKISPNPCPAHILFSMTAQIASMTARKARCHRFSFLQIPPSFPPLCPKKPKPCSASKITNPYYLPLRPP